jgi:phospholipase/carboxylesterase
MLSAHGLSYIKREPERGNVDRPPVLILLHGFASYENQLFELAREFDPRLLIVSVRAPIRMGPGAYRWFNFDYYGTIAQRPSKGPTINLEEQAASLATLTAFIEGFKAERKPDRLYLLAHSQGATMAFSVVMKRPSLISGLAEVNGRILPGAAADIAPAQSFAGLPFFIGHGVDNPIVPIALAQSTRQQLEGLRARVCYRQYPIGHEITAEVAADMSDWLSTRLDEPLDLHAPLAAS